MPILFSLPKIILCLRPELTYCSSPNVILLYNEVRTHLSRKVEIQQLPRNTVYCMIHFTIIDPGKIFILSYSIFSMNLNKLVSK